MAMALKVIAVALIGYFLGNFNTGMLIGKLVMHDDVRKYGSGNAGAANMFRFLGMRASLLTLLGDIIKAFLSSLIGYLLLGHYGALLGGGLCVVGHNWPVLYKFSGGKGIAATAGTLLFTQPLIALILLPLSLVFIRVIGVVSIVSLIAVFLQFVMMLILKWGDWPYLLYSFLLMAMGIFSHRENIQRIRSGEEMGRRLNFTKRER